MCAIKVAANVIGQFAQCCEEVKSDHLFPLADRILDWFEQEPSEWPQTTSSNVSAS